MMDVPAAPLQIKHKNCIIDGEMLVWNKLK